jgi:hypothetical protein
MRAKHPAAIILFLLLAFCLRLTYGLCGKFWSADELQVYLLGLKYFDTGVWPYFGPDVVYSHSKIPGALLGLLVGAPFRVLAMPEAPFIFLNILSFSGLCLLAWYCTKRFPGIPRWIIWVWLLAAPWTLNFSTHIVNPSYMLIAAIMFWIGYFESIPFLSMKAAPRPTMFFLMGFSLVWIYQLHMSWVLMLPFIASSFAWMLVYNPKQFLSSMLWFVGGSLTIGSLVLPTFIAYGWQAGLGKTAGNVVFMPENLKYFFHVLTRFLSLSSFSEIGSLGKNSHDRIEFAMRHIWVIPFIFVSVAGGVLQLGFMALNFFLQSTQTRPWHTVKHITIAAFLVAYLSFLFSIKGPSTHTLYLLLPLAMLYMCYCIEPLFQKRWIRKVVICIIVSGIVNDAAMGIDNFYRRSLYMDRARVVRAIVQKNSEILGNSDERQLDLSPT